MIKERFMSKNRVNKILSVIGIAVLLTGCSSCTSIITDETTFSEMMSEGFFSAIITYPLARIVNTLTPKVGIAATIAIVTITINAIILAFTFKSSIATQKIQELQPEMNKIQAKYEGKDDEMSKQRMAMEMQQLYDKYDINPIGTLITTFIQLPILLGMYNAFRRAEAVTTSTFLGASLAITPKEAFASKSWICVVIYVLMIVFQFLSVKTPEWIAHARGRKEAAKKHKTYQKPENPNAMSSYMMVLMIGFVMMSWPTALSLYYVIYSIVNIVKALVIDKITHKE